MNIKKIIRYCKKHRSVEITYLDGNSEKICSDILSKRHNDEFINRLLFEIVDCEMRNIKYKLTFGGD